jgi:hypothetical protein
MDKVEFVILNKKPIKFEFNEQEVLVLSYIPQDIKLDLAKKYLLLAFDGESSIDNYYGSEWSVVMGVIENCTNINLNDNNFETIISSGLWNEVKSRIVNYDEFILELKEIYRIEFEKRSLEKSLGVAVNNISNKLIEFIDNINSLDLSPEGISNLTEKLRDIVKETEEKFPNATSGKKPKKKRENKKVE